MGEIWDGSKKSFVKDTFNQLLGYVAGKDVSSVDTLTSTMTAEQMRNGTNGGKETGKDIVVRLGGLDWTVTYLSTDKSGNPILTLWLTNNEQDAWQSDANIHKSDAGDYYGFALGPQTNKYGLYSDWSGDWSVDSVKNGTAEFYPCNMYGTSYIRSVTLNNGGKYATSNTVLAEDPGQDANNVFAKFTMPSVEGNLTEFLVKPSQVSWQENQSAKESAGWSYKCANDEWNPADDTGYNGAAHNYAEHNGYDAWANDYIWLPSFAETGSNNSLIGLWEPSTQQRANYNGSTDSYTVDRIGTTQNKNVYNTAYTFSWLRSANYYDSYRAHSLANSGGYMSNTTVYCSSAVRPALHLNLKEAASTVVMTWDDYAASSYASGSGTAASPYIIKTPQQLAKLALDSRSSTLSGVHFKLGADIDMSEHYFASIGSGSYRFAGTFDGAMHRICHINTSFENSNGLFNKSNGVIRNLILSNSTFNIAANGDGGSLVGEVTGGIVENCIVDGVNIIAPQSENFAALGTLVGANNSGTIKNCISKNSSIYDGRTSDAAVGGLIGWRDGGTIENCAIYGGQVITPNRNNAAPFIQHGYAPDVYYAQVNMITESKSSLEKVIYGNSNLWDGFFYNEQINDGYPIPKTLVSLGSIDVSSETIYNALIAKGFKRI